MGGELWQATVTRTMFEVQGLGRVLVLAQARALAQG